MSAKRQTGETSALILTAQAFDACLQRFTALTDALREGALDTRRDLERAAANLQEVADCEGDLQAQARELMALLVAARDQQQAQAEGVRARAREIQQRTEQYAALVLRFEELGADAGALNQMARGLAARTQAGGQQLGSLNPLSVLAELDELQERMRAVAAAADGLSADARAANLDELGRRVDSLRGRLRAAHVRIGAVKDALARAIPPERAS